jgi:hypothetical protein
MKIKTSPFNLIGLWCISFALVGYSFYSEFEGEQAKQFPIIVGCILMAFSVYETWVWNKGIIIIEDSEMIIGLRSGIEIVIDCTGINGIRFEGDTMFVDAGNSAIKVPDVGISGGSKDSIIQYFVNNYKVA